MRAAERRTGTGRNRYRMLGMREMLESGDEETHVAVLTRLLVLHVDPEMKCLVAQFSVSFETEQTAHPRHAREPSHEGFRAWCAGLTWLAAV